VSEENKARAREFYGAINGRYFNTLESHVAEDFVDHEEIPGLVQPPG
jgi:hypothetical protein